MYPRIYRSATVATLTLTGILTFNSCQSKTTGAQAAPAMPPAAVSFITVAAQDVPIYNDYAAQTFARDMVEVRGRVDGYVERRLFQVGSDVRAGQPLYLLDIRPYRAEVDKAKGELAQSEANQEFTKRQVLLLQAQADLAQAQANLVKAEQDVRRLEPLVKEKAASQQDLDNAVASQRANEANVKARQANVEQMRLTTTAQADTAKAQVETSKATLRAAELNLEYGTINAPISGRIGDSLIQVGGLVSRNSTQPLTTIVPLDPIWVRFQISEAEYLNYQNQGNTQQLNKLPLELVLADNSIHPYPGKIQNTVNTVDPKTGTLELQATFPNPKHNLLPGQFGRIRLRADDRKNALLVPQRALQELQGSQSVMTLSNDNKVQVRSVVTAERVGDRIIILQGLKDGDRVIVEGLQKARPGAVVAPEPYQAPAAKGKK
ncbi:efflux RND transporter periplasmic adaptor subunit [Bryobacter aggregatus]|uniref:efflux RND transporter periplasmic adaptor subunit n=1 Tax=Bryobacter aggregatus TaxID=360054 RepID=UPI0009B5B98E|nr:efflux RND transporter periplasmic adaptor subunit [Bryobacter aggregatus]